MGRSERDAVHRLAHMEAGPIPKQPPTIGWREWAALPDLGIGAIKAKVDTGARTSALHAYKIAPFRRAGALWVRFELHPLQRSDAMKVACEARAIDERTVRNSGGGVEHRYIIETRLQLGDRIWPIELALANRDQMGFRMLLGRTALEHRVLVEPGRSYLLGTRRALPRKSRKLAPLKAGKLPR
ncbi:MAG: ATP-dependent zinc protease [Methyloceanibacter sp.]